MLLSSAPRVIIHRDRDFLTDIEVDQWGQPHTSRRIEVFSPPLCDTESYFATSAHVSKVTGVTAEEATSLIDSTIEERVDELRDKFRRKRQVASRTLNADGGGPITDDLWPEGSGPKPEQVYGKDLVKWLNAKLQQRGLLAPKKSLLDVLSDELGRHLETLLSRPEG